MQRKYVRKLGDLRGRVTYVITPLELSGHGFEYSSGMAIRSCQRSSSLSYIMQMEILRLQESCLPTT